MQIYWKSKFVKFVISVSAENPIFGRFMKTQKLKVV